MGDNETTTAQDKLQKIREKFVRQLPEKVGAIREAWEKLLRAEWNGEDVKNLCLLLHTLGGSAPSFGLRELGESAREAEKIARGFAEGEAPSDQVKSEFEKCLDQLAEHGADTWAEGSPVRTGDSDDTAGIDDARRNKVIFLLEDDADLLANLALQVECFGYEVRSFRKIDHFRKAVGVQVPTVVIADMMFDEGEFAGADVVAEMQKEHGIKIPSIFISQRNNIQARLRAVQAGGEAYFLKPVSISELIVKLDMLTSNKPVDPYRILIIDDDADLAAYHSLILQQHGMVTRTVNDPMQILRHMVAFRPDLVLMDMYMPQCNGQELARVIRQIEDYAGIPIVFLSSETDVDKQLKAMRMGGDDFLTKPINTDHLISSVVIRAERMRTIRTFMEQDSLTGLLNHTKLEEQLDSAIHKCKSSNGSFAYAMIDVDHFKKVNDTYGHLAGDRVLVILSRLLKQRLRTTDIVGRYGGEEFAVILPDTDMKNAFAIMDQLRRNFSKIRHESYQKEFSVTFSCGLACYPQYREPTSLNTAADKALYRAKQGGRNVVMMAGAEGGC